MYTPRYGHLRLWLRLMMMKQHSLVQIECTIYKATVKCCHYFGWLGSRPNLESIIERHCPHSRHKGKSITQADLPFSPHFSVTSDICVVCERLELSIVVGTHWT